MDMDTDFLFDLPAVPGDRRHVYGVTELTRRIKETLEDAFGHVWVEGEVSNLRIPSSGHAYFTLKDDRSQLNAVMFRGDLLKCSDELKDGLNVRVYGEITVYEARGQHQIIVRRFEPAGKGALLQQFEDLKKKLSDEGLFAPERKQPLPLLPRRVGIVTSPTGAAIRDILQILGRRFPNLHLLVAPVKVQGEGAAAQIAAAIGFLNQRDDIDVIIVGRGGGSLEDLWAFNEETVARAIAASRIPVISAVGHEIDFTISDFVADVRAPTPSAAAEIVVGRKDEFLSRLQDQNRRLVQALRSNAQVLRTRLTRAAHSYVFREPANLVARKRQRLEGDFQRMRHVLRSQFQQQQQRMDELGLVLAHRTESRTTGLRERLTRLSAQLRVLNPGAVLDRGYSITRGPGGRIVRRPKDVNIGDRLVTLVGKGTIESDVRNTTPGEHHGSEKGTP